MPSVDGRRIRAEPHPSLRRISNAKQVNAVGESTGESVSLLSHLPGWALPHNLRPRGVSPVTRPLGPLRRRPAAPTPAAGAQEPRYSDKRLVLEQQRAAVGARPEVALEVVRIRCREVAIDVLRDALFRTTDHRVTKSRACHVIIRVIVTRA
jgi:hypothetical protein